MNSILKTVCKDFDVFRWLQFNYAHGKWVGIKGDKLLIPDSTFHIEGLPDDPDELEEQTVTLAIITILANEQGGESVKFNPEEFLEATNILRTHLCLERLEEAGVAQLNWEDTDEYGLPKVSIDVKGFEKYKEYRGLE